VFRTFDQDGSGQLDRRELGRMLAQLMPELSANEVGRLGGEACLEAGGCVCAGAGWECGES